MDSDILFSILFNLGQGSSKNGVVLGSSVSVGGVDAESNKSEAEKMLTF